MIKIWIKSKLKYILIVGITAIICISGTVFATFQYNAKQVEYKDGKNVETALNELYSKLTPTQVGTMTAQGQEYTFQNNGYITGTIKSLYNQAGAYIFFNEREKQENIVAMAQWDVNDTYKVSVFVPKGTKVLTRENYGTYNLTLYEFK